MIEFEYNEPFGSLSEDINCQLFSLVGASTFGVGAFLYIFIIGNSRSKFK